jgi:hypothetical protein
MYKSETWSSERKIVIVRQNLSEKPNAPGKQLKLFLKDEIINSYRYSAYTTSLKLALLKYGDCTEEEVMQKIESKN